YHADLIGLAAVDQSGKTLGTVVAVHNFGAGDLIEVKPPAGGGTELVPFDMTHVPEVDIASGRLVIHPPDGLFKASRPKRDGGSLNCHRALDLWWSMIFSENQ